MQLSSIIPILLIFISAVWACIGSSNNDIQAISKRGPKRPDLEEPTKPAKRQKIQFPDSMDELSSFVVDSNKFESIWAPYRNDEPDLGAIAGQRGYYSYRLLREDTVIGIIKGIWASVGETAVIQEGKYLQDAGMLDAFLTNPDQSVEKDPRYVFIIKNDEYASQYEALTKSGLSIRELNKLRENARERLKRQYNPEPSFLSQFYSFLYKKNTNTDKWEAIFI